MKKREEKRLKDYLTDALEQSGFKGVSGHQDRSSVRISFRAPEQEVSELAEKLGNARSKTVMDKLCF